MEEAGGAAVSGEQARSNTQTKPAINNVSFIVDKQHSLPADPVASANRGHHRREKLDLRSC
jgi:hypothetical protein